MIPNLFSVRHGTGRGYTHVEGAAHVELFNLISVCGLSVTSQRWPSWCFVKSLCSHGLCGRQGSWHPVLFYRSLAKCVSPEIIIVHMNIVCVPIGMLPRILRKCESRLGKKLSEQTYDWLGKLIWWKEKCIQRKQRYILPWKYWKDEFSKNLIVLPAARI